MFDINKYEKIALDFLSPIKPIDEKTKAQKEADKAISSVLKEASKAANKGLDEASKAIDKFLKE